LHHPAEEGWIMKIEIERETDGRWIAEAPELPGVMAYGSTRDEAIRKAEALALRVIAAWISADQSAEQKRR
jgi:predicted RNase H-like HicB family nuclease